MAEAHSKTMQVAIQGERGSFSDEAAHRLCDRLQLVPCTGFEEVFRRLHARQVEAAVIPIENTLAGSVGINYDLLRREAAWIGGETSVRIAHQLMVHPSARMSQIRRVLSHPVALDQCRTFLGRHPEWEVVPFYDTAGSAKHLIEQKLTDTAAIASAAAAQVYGARILRRGIEDNKQNFTRFFLLRRVPPRGVTGNKVSLVFSTRNQAGALFRCLSAFALRDISLTRIESRPVPGRPWEYHFYLDFLGHLNEDRVRNAVGHLRELTDELKILGCYRDEMSTSTGTAAGGRRRRVNGTRKKGR